MPVTTQQPYADSFQQYLAAGWQSPLPLPTGKKAHPPTGYTGYDADTPSGADCWAWSEDPKKQNIALRLPPGVVGIDVDNYGDKTGGETLTRLVEACGALPATWKSTSRDDSISGIYLFRVPPETRLVTKLDGHIEIIQPHHRYLVAQPSLHPEGRTYQWINEQTGEVGGIPEVEMLPPLPDTWRHHLADTNPQTSSGKTYDADIAQIISELPTGEPCHHVKAAFTHIAGDGARHDMYNAAVLAAFGAGRRGCPGANQVVGRLHRLWLRDTEGDRTRGEADAEWTRNYVGALQKIASEPQGVGCRDDLTELVIAPPAPATPSADTAAGEPSIDLTTTSDTVSSWHEADITAMALGDWEPPEATILQRNDGQGLAYAGKVNALIGESESGKSWIALEAVRQEVAAGHRVLLIDFEDSPQNVVSRLKALSVTRWDLIRYVHPDEDPIKVPAANQELKRHLAWQPSLMVVDGVNAGMVLMGFDINSNDDATKFHTKFLRPLTSTGAAVISIDHVPKNIDNRGKGGIGAQAKRAMVDGAIIRVEATTAPAPGKIGSLRLSVDKDRPGSVRAAGNGSFTAQVTIDSSQVNANFQAMTTISVKAAAGPVGDQDDALKEKISGLLETYPGLTIRKVEAHLGGKRDRVRDALVDLTQGGYVTVTVGPRNSHQHYVKRPFNRAGGGK